MRGWILAILDINFRQRIDVGSFARSRSVIAGGCVVGLFESRAAGSRIAVSPQPVIVRHRYAPLAHRARGILQRDLRKSLTRLFVLERVKQRNRPVKRFADGFRTRRRKMNRAYFFHAQIVMMLVLGSGRRDEKNGAKEESR